MRIFVSGATGFLGGHLVQSLLDSGSEVTALVRDWHPAGRWAKELSGRCRSVRGDLSDLKLLERALAEYGIEAVVHLAAQTQVSTAVQNALGTFDANVVGTWNILEASRRQGVKRIVVASTDKAFGRTEPPYSENLSLTPDRPYETSKACADMISRTYAATYGMKIAVTRCVNLFGPWHLNFSTLVAGTVKRILSGQPPVLRAGGKMKRDFLYVDDAVDGYMRLLSSDYSGPMCFGTGRGVSVLEVVTLILKIMKSNLRPITEPDVHGEISHQWSSYDLARKTLGWTPKHKLEQALEKTVKWYVEYLK